MTVPCKVVKFDYGQGITNCSAAGSTYGRVIANYMAVQSMRGHAQSMRGRAQSIRVAAQTMRGRAQSMRGRAQSIRVAAQTMRGRAQSMYMSAHALRGRKNLNFYTKLTKVLAKLSLSSCTLIPLSLIPQFSQRPGRHPF
jgi:hypothetical protein